MTPQPLASRRVIRHVEPAGALDRYGYTGIDGTTLIELDIVVSGAVDHSDVGVQCRRIHDNDDLVHDRRGSDDGRER